MSRNPDKTIADYLNEVIAKTGEKITIKRFARFQIGGIAVAAKYQRILLKLSGEALMGDQGFGISPEMIAYVADEVRPSSNWGFNWPLWSAAAISSAALPPVLLAWSGHRPITWACWPR
jgi:hypothetical protein